MNGKAQEAPGSPPPIVLHPEVGLLNKIMVIRANMIFFADAVDIVRRANIFMWSNFAPHENLSVLCGRNLLSMKSNFAPYASLDQQTWTRSGLTISPTNDDSCIKSWNGGTLLQVFTKFGLVVPLTYRSQQLDKHQNQILGNTANLPEDWEACWGPHLAGPLMKFPWARRSKPPLFRQHWARSLPIKGWDYSTLWYNKSDVLSKRSKPLLPFPFLLKVQCVQPFVSWQLFWHSWALPAGLGFRPGFAKYCVSKMVTNWTEGLGFSTSTKQICKILRPKNGYKLNIWAS